MAAGSTGIQGCRSQTLALASGQSAAGSELKAMVSNRSMNVMFAVTSYTARIENIVSTMLQVSVPREGVCWPSTSSSAMNMPSARCR